MRALLYGAFLLSGAAGLIYEAVWSRYLALFVGHSAYAQVLVIGTFLGGMALGALLIGQRSQRLKRPLAWYAMAELALCALGLAFDPAFRSLTDASYRTLFPALAGTGLVTTVKWSVAAGMILPASVLLGTTFPLMSAGVLRAFPRGAGRTLGSLYFVNSLGGAIGVLVAGFVLFRVGGLPGSLRAAALLNIVAAAGAYLASRNTRTTTLTGHELERALAQEPGVGSSGSGQVGPRAPGLEAGRLWRLLLTVSFFTALASFIYEIGWIRMLSLVMGSATHSFEIMLSAFILGLALGAMEVRRWADYHPQPLRVLGWIQWAMGLAAVATLPIYLASFDWIGQLLQALARTDSGYALFNLARYGLAAAVMLPSTVLAGMTLPLITVILLRSGKGERAIGWVYGVNTLGSIAGVVTAGLILLPWLGLKGMLVAGATLDMALGVILLSRAPAPAGEASGRRIWVLAALGTLIVALGVPLGFEMDRAVLTSGVYRYGQVSTEETRPILYYKDGRTATVAAFLTPVDSARVLTTNGKPDASLSQSWILAGRGELDQVEPEPIRRQDETTQIFLSILALAHHPEARNAVVIGQGSGVSGHYLLGSPGLEGVTTVELEPAMIEGSRVFYPANRRVFDDPRSEVVIADAKAFFAERQQEWDIVGSEPSNPWVSGTASLFTEEFYRRVRSVLAEDGVLVQWIHLYELSDALVGSVLAALHRHFPFYRAYLANAGDLILVASPSSELSDPDWSVFDLPPVAEDLAHHLPFRAHDMESLWVFDQASMGPLLEHWEEPNSDFFPVLDLGAERARYLALYAEGIRGMAADRFSLAAALAGKRHPLRPYTPPPVPDIYPMNARARGAWLRATGPARQTPEEVPEGYGEPLREYRELLRILELDRPPEEWRSWVRQVVSVEIALHRGTAGAADTAFYGRVFRYLDRWPAPEPARASVHLLHGAAVWGWEEAAAATQVLLSEVRQRRMWLPPALVLDAGVVALLRTGRVEEARTLYRVLAPATGRSPGDFRLRVLRAHLTAAGGGGPGQEGG